MAARCDDLLCWTGTIPSSGVPWLPCFLAVEGNINISFLWLVLILGSGLLLVFVDGPLQVSFKMSLSTLQENSSAESS
jgi:hypothetical protein